MGLVQLWAGEWAAAHAALPAIISSLHPFISPSTGLSHIHGGLLTATGNGGDGAKSRVLILFYHFSLSFVRN